ncbi:hypothetical protein KW807_00915 [Candidatus Parcubacteria bacterium]|nr:hypothetical protein [Candidatus Parcubacteria bacterium]
MDETPVYRRGGAQRRITDAARSLAEKLNKEIEKGNDNSAFMIAVLLAAFKDFLDIILTVTFVGLIPGVDFVVGLFLTSFLFFFMLGKGWFLKWRLRVWFWVLGLFFDGLPLFSALPTNTLLVLYAWRLTKKRKVNAEVKMKDLHNLTEKEINALNADISLLENDHKGYVKNSLRPTFNSTPQQTRNTNYRPLLQRVDSIAKPTNIGGAFNSKERFIKKALNNTLSRPPVPPPSVRRPLEDRPEESTLRQTANSNNGVRNEKEELRQILSDNFTPQHQELIQDTRQSKLNWVQSESFATRLKNKGASDEDVEQIKNKLTQNALDGNVYILSPENFSKTVDHLHRVTGETNIKEAAAFHNPENKMVVLKQSSAPPMPPLPGKPAQPYKPTLKVDETQLHHEYGHLVAGDLWKNKIFKDWNPKFKTDAPDPEYVGKIQETDTRIRSMFRDLGGKFNPNNQKFTPEHLKSLREMGGKISNDTRDLLAHYDDEELVRLANEMPAI